jgi:hypothetical protein
MSTTIKPTKAEERWLRCQLDKGMFNDEVAVTYPPQGPWQKSVFVDANLVEGTIGGIGRVRVKTIRRDGSLMAVLPSSYQDIVIVQAEDISEE